MRDNFNKLDIKDMQDTIKENLMKILKMSFGRYDFRSNGLMYDLPFFYEQWGTYWIHSGGTTIDFENEKELDSFYKAVDRMNKQDKGLFEVEVGDDISGQVFVGAISPIVSDLY